MLKMNSKLTASVLAAVMVGAFGCAHSSTQVKTDKAPDAVVQQNIENPVLETTSVILNFEPGQHYLSQVEKSNLSEVIEKANFDASTDRLDVAVWSDRNLPTDGSSLAKEDKKMAKERSLQIKNFLKSKYNITSIKFYNMAEQSNWVAKAFNTRDAELKTLFAKNESAPMTDEQFNVIKDNGAPGKAVIVVTHK